VRTGTIGNDRCDGSIIGDLASGTTLNPGDNLNGGDGTADTLELTLSGNPTSSFLVQTKNIEKLNVGNYDTDNASDATLNLASASGITDIKMTGGGGDTIFTGVASKVNLELSGSAGDVTLTYASGVLAGTDDTQNITLTNAGTANDTVALEIKDADGKGAETLAITSNGSANHVKLSTNTDYKTVTVTGAGKLTMDADGETTVTKIDASAATGGVSIRNLGASNITITGGAGKDALRIDGSTVDSNDSINAGDGTDTLELTAAVGSAAAGAKLAGFDNLYFYQDTTNSTSVTFSQDVGFISGITDVGVSKASYLDDNDSSGDNATFNLSFTGMSATQTGSIAGITSGGDSNDNGTLTVNVSFDLANDTNSDSGKITLGTASAAAATAGANNPITLNVTANDYEDLTLVSQGGSNSINTLTASDATKLTINASKKLTITTLTAGFLKTIDAAASTADVSVGSTSIASTVTGGAGNDTLAGSAQADSISGSAGNDSITGRGGNDTLMGGDGNDIFADAADNNESVSGGTGNDTFKIGAFSNLTSADTIDGGDGIDTLSFDQNANHDFTSDITILSNVTSVEKFLFTAISGKTVIVNDAVVSAAGGTLTLQTSSNYANTFDASSVLGNSSKVVFSATSTVATGQIYKIGNGIDSVTLSSGSDTVEVTNSVYLSANDTIDGGTGTDTLKFTQASNSTITTAQLANVKGFETFSVATGTAQATMSSR